MGDMFDSDVMHLDCQTCLAANTTACEACVVTHLLANDDGPIELVVAPDVPFSVDRAVALLTKAGLLDDPPEFVSVDDFESADLVGAVR